MAFDVVQVAVTLGGYRGQERWNHDDAKPSNVKAVVGRRNEGSKSSPNG